MENQNEFIERRKSFRLAVNAQIQYRIFSEHEKKPITEWMQGITENVSADGLRLKTFCDDDQIDILTNEPIVVSVEFQLPETEYSLACEAKIVYFNKITQNKENEKTAVFLGLSFTNMDVKGKNVISDFIRKTQ